jgi:hypothetical protein
MHGSLTEQLREWHDFYMLVGTASGTLVGLMFVSASIGASYYNESHRAAMRAFVSPTVMHFSEVLFICVLAMVPSHTWMTLGALLGVGGLFGVAHSGIVVFTLLVRQRFTVDISDRMFYALVPVLGYALVLTAGILLLIQSSWSFNVIAAALMVLLVAAIRNAWDMTLWVVIRAPTLPTPPEPPPGP